MKNTQKGGLLALIMLFWFTISFITNILGPLIPDIIRNFGLKELALAGFIPTSFFLAYAVMSIPAGMLIDRYGEKPVLSAGFSMPLAGCVLFACLPHYPVLLVSSFIIGLGMAMLQTVINPLQRTVGGEENYAFIAELAQFVFGAASFVSPLAYTWLVHALAPGVYRPGQNRLVDLLATLTPPDLPWVSLYWIFAVLLLLMLLAVLAVRFPRISRREEERGGSAASYKQLFRQRYVWLFFLGIFCYVSTEQGVSIFMSTFLEQYHGIDPNTLGARTISYFWGAMTAGCLIGIFLLKLVDSKRLLQVSGFLSMLLLLAALFGSAETAIRAFPAVGFCISLMYSIVFSLALNSATQNHGSFAGILCSGIAGGAGGPLLVSLLADATSLRTGMLLILVFMAYITGIGYWARPLVNNKTVSLKKLFGRNEPSGCPTNDSNQ
ncbi:MAG: sugar MFS transporter [Parabacteroides sp.]|nr:sugar MFS transporter [Parabacteroides sp.]